MLNIRKLFDYSQPKSLGSILRLRRIHIVKDLIVRIHAKKGSLQILDVGGTVDYWKVIDHSFLVDNGVTVTLLNLGSPQKVTDGTVFKSVQGN